MARRRHNLSDAEDAATPSHRHQGTRHRWGMVEAVATSGRQAVGAIRLPLRIQALSLRRSSSWPSSRSWLWFWGRSPSHTTTGLLSSSGTLFLHKKPSFSRSCIHNVDGFHQYDNMEYNGISVFTSLGLQSMTYCSTDSAGGNTQCGVKDLEPGSNAQSAGTTVELGRNCG